MAKKLNCSFSGTYSTTCYATVVIEVPDDVTDEEMEDLDFESLLAGRSLGWDFERPNQDEVENHDLEDLFNADCAAVSDLSLCRDSDGNLVIQ